MVLKTKRREKPQNLSRKFVAQAKRPRKTNERDGYLNFKEKGRNECRWNEEKERIVDLKRKQ